MFRFSRKYTIQVHNLESNEWEEVSSARTLDEAFEEAEKYVGFSKAHDTVEILNQMDSIVWSSDKPLVSQRMKDLGLEEQERESHEVAEDGSC